MMGHVSFIAEGRAGNYLFKAAATIGYALDHGLEYTMPTTSRDAKWCPLYLQHLVNPEFDPSLETITVKEKGFRFQELPFSESWRNKNIILDGYWQSPLHFAAHRERVLEAFGFPWELRAGFCGVHIRRGDYLVHITKHPAVTKEWYLAQMAKFPGFKFVFFSDDPEWVFANFECNSGEARLWNIECADPRPEVRDLVLMSQCEHLIGSASTFAVFAGLLNRNPEKRVIIPKQWLCEGWGGTTAVDWLDICPVGGGWERA